MTGYIVGVVHELNKKKGTAIIGCNHGRFEVKIDKRCKWPKDWKGIYVEATIYRVRPHTERRKP